MGPQQAMEVVSRHAYVLDPRVERTASALHVQIDAALPIGANPVPQTGRGRAADRLTVAGRAGSQLQPPALLGVLARLSRFATGGVLCQSLAGDRAVFRGTVAGCAVRLRVELCA